MRARWLAVALAAAGCHDAAADDDPTLTPREQLGRMLFADPSLSNPPGESCASCHDAEHGFTGTAGSPVAAVARGSRPDQLGNRNVPTVVYASFSPRFAFVDGAPIGGEFWDGRAADLVAQAEGPLLNPREMNQPDAAAVLAAIARSDEADRFRAIYGDGASLGDVADAIAAYEETDAFHPFSSKFDDSLRGDAQLDDAEARGFALFTDPDKGNCIACHAGTPGSHDPRDWLFTDFSYDNLGLPRNHSIPANADPSVFDLGLCARADLASIVPTGVDPSTLCGAFKVPTLRDIALTAPYGHNGVFPDLRTTLRFYVTRDTDPTHWYTDGTLDDLPAEYADNVNHDEVPYDRHPGEAPRLTDAEIDDVIAFLGTLTDE